ncbi:ArsR family transcriptional regulator [Halorubrum sp. JWXQ-INN 858]|uniref:winged helix-turn-helix domain-containing protein n=1 Tax=Halorubrum sp. JWXQ-INN 858 TaxID=2690782 RepID=UPI0013FAAD2A|nr:winged helix-turn-helix domain-containing protein [Halorubrum sp. JWXQ-INN 858]MWV65469.1 ArsR family transcriptional regulator [Halorubrum sp. JWXQ-INN 858]
MSENWDDIGFVISSQYRVTVLSRLAMGPSTPSQIADDEGIDIAAVSHALTSLRDRGFVELLVPEDRRKGRVYGITDDGEAIWLTIENEGLLED